MPRPRRQLFENATYHVTIRGVNGEAVFRSDHDRYAYLGLLARIRTLASLQLFAYALMDNHIHLVLRTVLPNLSTAMQRLHGIYAARFNRTYGRSGHLFGDRFYSSVITDVPYLLESTRYVHLNAVRAGLVRRPEDYPWSSYRLYVSPEVTGSIVDVAIALQYFSTDPDNARAAYTKFVLDGMAGPPLRRGADLSPLKSRLLAVVSEVTGTPLPEVLRGRRGAEARGICLYLARELTGLHHGKIGEAFGCSRPTVGAAVARIRHRAAIDAQLRERLRVIRRLLRRPPASGSEKPF